MLPSIILQKIKVLVGEIDQNFLNDFIEDNLVPQTHLYSIEDQAIEVSRLSTEIYLKSLFKSKDEVSSLIKDFVQAVNYLTFEVGGFIQALYGFRPISAEEHGISGTQERQFPVLNLELLMEQISDGIINAPIAGDKTSLYGLIRAAHKYSDTSPINEAKYIDYDIVYENSSKTSGFAIGVPPGDVDVMLWTKIHSHNYLDMVEEVLRTVADYDRIHLRRHVTFRDVRVVAGFVSDLKNYFVGDKHVDK